MPHFIDIGFEAEARIISRNSATKIPCVCEDDEIDNCEMPPPAACSEKTISMRRDTMEEICFWDERGQLLASTFEMREDWDDKQLISAADFDMISTAEYNGMRRMGLKYTSYFPGCWNPFAADKMMRSRLQARRLLREPPQRNGAEEIIERPSQCTRLYTKEEQRLQRDKRTTDTTRNRELPRNSIEPPVDPCKVLRSRFKTAFSRSERGLPNNKNRSTPTTVAAHDSYLFLSNSPPPPPLSEDPKNTFTNTSAPPSSSSTTSSCIASFIPYRRSPLCQAASFYNDSTIRSELSPEEESNGREKVEAPACVVGRPDQAIKSEEVEEEDQEDLEIASNNGKRRRRRRRRESRKRKRINEGGSAATEGEAEDADDGGEQQQQRRKWIKLLSVDEVFEEGPEPESVPAARERDSRQSGEMSVQQHPTPTMQAPCGEVEGRCSCRGRKRRREEEGHLREDGKKRRGSSGDRRGRTASRQNSEYLMIKDRNEWSRRNKV